MYELALYTWSHLFTWSHMFFHQPYPPQCTTPTHPHTHTRAHHCRQHRAEHQSLAALIPLWRLTASALSWEVVRGHDTLPAGSPIHVLPCLVLRQQGGAVYRLLEQRRSLAPPAMVGLAGQRGHMSLPTPPSPAGRTFLLSRQGRS
jgi:hypothetical protein